jgi:hypothetical protein
MIPVPGAEVARRRSSGSKDSTSACLRARYVEKLKQAANQKN